MSKPFLELKLVACSETDCVETFHTVRAWAFRRAVASSGRAAKVVARFMTAKTLLVPEQFRRRTDRVPDSAQSSFEPVF